MEDIKSSQSLHTLQDHVNHVKENLKLARTGSLWLMLMQIVAIMRMLIRIECTANWHLHLKSTHDILPYFAAAGNNNYAKCCRLYLQDLQDMCVYIKKPLEEGAFTIHRNENLFWSGTWTDMTIEQSLMRSGKTHGVLDNITHKESARTKLLLTSHIVAQYTEALRKLTENAGGRSERHRELIQGSRIWDHDDLQTFLVLLRSHNPFSSDDPTQPRNISRGVVADHGVNFDDALNIGAKIQERLTGKDLEMSQ